ncbi:MAG TPA: phage major capsid protein [Phycisphaerae bacterium]|nr:phage major capsid protein [Phycisphaerae bacterium]
MKKKVKLSKDWGEHKAGSVLEVDGATFDEIIEAKAGTEVKEDEEKGFAAMIASSQKAIVDKATDAAVKAVETKLREFASDETKMIHIQVKDRSDADPTFGYLPGNTKSLKELSRDEVAFAFGRFATDVMRASNGRESETLMKCRERSQKMITKAAGDGMIVGSDQEGGYLIFSAASQMLQTAALENAIVRPRANRVTMSTQLLQLPYLRDQTHASGTVYGGIQVYFDDELAQYTESKPKLARIELKLKKMTALGFASDEWIKWSPVTLGSWLIPKFGEAIGWKEDLVFLNGKGGGQPLGILNAPAKIEQAKESGQTASTFVLENSTGMFARLKVRQEAKVAWLMNRTVFPQLPLFNIAVGTGGAPVFVQNAGDTPGQRLWGYPIIWTEKVPALGTASAVCLVDFSDYLIADDQSGPEVAQSIHLKFDYGQTAFRLTKYIDGQNETDAAFQPYKGNTLSPTVTLAA